MDCSRPKGPVILALSLVMASCQSMTSCTKLHTSPIISNALLHTLTHCIPNSTMVYQTPLSCVMLYCPPYPCPHTCCLFVHLFVCLSVFLSITCCLPCLFISPFRLFPLLIGSMLTLCLTA